MQNSEMIWNAVGYTRLSKDDKEKEESGSIQNQREMILDYAGKNPAIRVVNMLSDDGYTGANFNRAAFKEMISYIEQGMVNCVIVKDFSRLARDHIGAGKFIDHYFKEKKVRFISINDNYDSLTADKTDSSNGLLVPFKNIINEAFLEDISTKTKSQLEIKRKNGEFVCNYAVYGYSKSCDKTLVIDEYAADVVRSIFDYKLGGYNERQIADMLNAKGILPPSEYKRSLGIAYNTPFAVNGAAQWSANTIKRILTNRVYIGVLEQGKRAKASYRVSKCFYKPQSEWSVHENAHEPIISMSDFTLVGKLMAKDLRVSVGSGQLHMFSGVIVCGACGQQMVLKMVNRNGKCYTYFVCSTHKKYGDCSKNGISDKAIEKLTLYSIKRQIASFSSSAELNCDFGYDTLQSRQQHAINEKIENQLDIIRTYNDYLVSSYEHLVEGFVTTEEYALLKYNFNRKITAAENAVEGLREQLNKLHDNTQSRELMNQFSGHENITELNRRIVVNLVDSIIVHSVNDVEIRFRYDIKSGLSNDSPLSAYSTDCERAVI